MAKTEDEKTQEAFDAITRAEAKRKVNAIKVLAGVLVGALAITGLAYAFGGGLTNEVPVEKGEKETLSQTNDPQCRAMIKHVGALRTEFKNVELDVESDLLGTDMKKVAELRKSFKTLRQKLAVQKVESKKATLRYDHSRKELDIWFTYMDTELLTLDKIADFQIKSAEARTRGEALVDLTIKRKRPGQKKPRTKAQKRDAAVVSIYDGFDKFRVWHTAGFHPCGAASADETPWTPAVKDKKK